MSERYGSATSSGCTCRRRAGTLIGLLDATPNTFAGLYSGGRTGGREDDWKTHLVKYKTATLVPSPGAPHHHTWIWNWTSSPLLRHPPRPLFPRTRLYVAACAHPKLHPSSSSPCLPAPSAPLLMLSNGLAQCSAAPPASHDEIAR